MAVMMHNESACRHCKAQRQRGECCYSLECECRLRWIERRNLALRNSLTLFVDPRKD